MVVFLIIIKFIKFFVYSWAGSLSSMALSLERSNQTQNQEKEVWAFGLCSLAAWVWLAVSSPSALLSVNSGMTGIPVWREPAWRHICKNHECPGGDTGNRNSSRSTDLMPLPDFWQWHWEKDISFLPFVDLSFKKKFAFVQDSLLSWDTSNSVIMGQADVSRPVNPDAVGE